MATNYHDLLIKLGMLPRHARTEFTDLEKTKLTDFVLNYPIESPHSFIVQGSDGIGKNTALSMLVKRAIEYNKLNECINFGGEKILVRRMPKFIYSWVGVKPEDLMSGDMLVIPNFEQCPFVNDLPGILAKRSANPLFFALMSCGLRTNPKLVESFSQVCTIYTTKDVKAFTRTSKEL